MGLPGLVDNDAGVVVTTPNMPFRNTPFRELFQRELDSRCTLGNDADCAAAGEYWAGAAKGCDPVVMITLGTGIGGGLVRGGKLYTGFGGAGMEVGHLVTHPEGMPCGCGNRGCWERYGSATALIQQTRRRWRRTGQRPLGRVRRRPEPGGGPHAVPGGGPGGPDRPQVLERYRRELSYGLISLCNILFPEVICLGGGGERRGRRACCWTPCGSWSTGAASTRSALPKLVRASLGNDAGVVGAAMLCRM